MTNEDTSRHKPSEPRSTFQMRLSREALDEFMHQVSDEHGLLDAASAEHYEGNAWGVTWNQRLVFPGFQFDEARVRPVIAELRRLADQHGVHDMGLLVFLCSPTTYVEDDGRPVSLIDEPAQLIAMTQRALGVVW